jgi:hypothetical protein
VVVKIAVPCAAPAIVTMPTIVTTPVLVTMPTIVTTPVLVTPPAPDEDAAHEQRGSVVPRVGQVGVGSGYVQKVVTSRETLKYGMSSSKAHLYGH